MSAMRAVLSRETGQDLSRMSNDAVVSAIAGLLSRGRWHIHALPARPVVAQPAGRAASASAAAFVVPAPPPRPASAVFRRPVISDPPTFPPAVNLSQQAAALIAAAAQGAPFCPT